MEQGAWSKKAKSKGLRGKGEAYCGFRIVNLLKERGKPHRTHRTQKGIAKFSL
jgi:hypothetical protein